MNVVRSQYMTLLSLTHSFCMHTIAQQCDRLVLAKIISPDRPQTRFILLEKHKESSTAMVAG